MKINMALVLAATLAASIGTAQADTLGDIKSRGKLICGVLAAAPPLSAINPLTNVAEGYEVDLCKAIGKVMNVDVELSPVTSETRIPELLAGHVDFLAAFVSYTPQRAEQADFSNAYFMNKMIMVVRDDSPDKTLKDLTGDRIGMEKGSFLEKEVPKIVPNATVVSFDDTASAFLALQQGKVQGEAGSAIGVRSMQLRAGAGTAATRILDEPVMSLPLAFVVRKGETALVDELNKDLAELESSGEGQKIWDKWLGKDSDLKFERTFKLGQPIAK